MIPFFNLPFKIIKLFDSNISSSEIASGVCMSMFMGFMPLNGFMGLLLFLCFFMFKINRLTAMLLLPLFKLFYVLGIVHLCDIIGGWLLIDLKFLSGFWNIVTGFPVIAFFDLNKTLVTGGLCLSVLLCFPVYMVSKKGASVIKEKYAEKLGKSKFIKAFKKIPIINKIIILVGKSRGMV